jgi:hypothetical protein
MSIGAWELIVLVFVLLLLAVLIGGVMRIASSVRKRR